jgi:maleylpyruvate isomerase
MTTYRLHSYWRSSASFRVRIALAHKGLEYEYVALNIVKDGGEQNRDDYRLKNPLTQVPTLEVLDGAHSAYLTQSMAIVEYLEETHPSHPLLPSDPLQRAHARAFAEGVNSGIQPFQNLPVLAEVEAYGKDKLAWAKKWNERGLDGLEQLAVAWKRGRGRFVLGDSPSIADVFLFPQMGAARRFGVDTELHCPRLCAIEKECAALPAFQAALPEKQPDAPPG